MVKRSTLACPLLSTVTSKLRRKHRYHFMHNKITSPTGILTLSCITSLLSCLTSWIIWWFGWPHLGALLTPLHCCVFLQSIFESIKKEPFKIPEDDGNDLNNTFFNPDKEGWLWKQGWSMQKIILYDIYNLYIVRHFDVGWHVEICGTSTCVQL